MQVSRPLIFKKTSALFSQSVPKPFVYILIIKRGGARGGLPYLMLTFRLFPSD